MDTKNLRGNLCSNTSRDLWGSSVLYTAGTCGLKFRRLELGVLT
jgi:hypothetical protein